MTAQPTDLVVTTSKDGRPRERIRAAAVARRLQVPLVRPEQRPPGTRTYRVRRDGEDLVYPDGRRLYPHPGLLAQKLHVGPSHPFLRAVRGHGSRRSLRVLDGTAGLGQDSLHLASSGFEVLAVEQQPILGCLLRGAVRQWCRGGPCAHAARQIRVVIGSIAEVLSHLPPLSLDAIFLDPMFETPGLAAPDYDLLRKEACGTAVSASVIRQATLVARERVIMKVPANEKPRFMEPLETESLGFNRRVTARAFDYWVVEKTIHTPEWEATKVRRRGDVQPAPPGPAPAPGHRDR